MVASALLNELVIMLDKGIGITLGEEKSEKEKEEDLRRILARHF